MLATEMKALVLAAPGPFAWASPEDLWSLKELYGQTRSFNRLAHMAQASQLRVAANEKWSQHGGQLGPRAKRMSDLQARTDFAARRYMWGDWYARSHLLVLHRNRIDLAMRDISIARVKADLRAQCATNGENAAGDEQEEKVEDEIKKRFQREVQRRIKEAERPNAEERVRFKIERWHLANRPRIAVARILDHLNRLRGSVAPRVQSACFGTVWNRWTTFRRFQRRHSKENRCMLGCEGQAEDSIEHYAHCRAVRRVARSFLR